MKTSEESKLKNENRIGDFIVLRKMRELRKLSRDEAGLLIGKSRASVQRDETNKTKLSSDKINRYLEAYNYTKTDFMNLKLGKLEAIDCAKKPQKLKIIENNHLRRSYQKIITREAKVLAILRKKRGLNQYQASAKCGYDKSAIGWIENGRMELTDEKKKYIVRSYGFTMEEFYKYLDCDFDRDEIEQNCVLLIKNLNNEKLKSVSELLKNFA